MSLQSSHSSRKWNFSTTVRHGLQIAFVLALFLVSVQGHGQTNGSRTSLAASRDGATTHLTATVKDPTGAAISGGVVNFVSNGASLGSSFVKEDGTATVTVDKLPAKTTAITAVYTGDESHASSASAQVTAQPEADGGLPDFSISANPASLSLTAGDFGTSILTVSPENGFSQAVTLTVSGLPGATTSKFTPASVTPVPAALTSTLQIQTTANSGAQLQNMPLSGNNRMEYALIPGVLALFGLGALRKRNGHWLRMVGMFVLLLAGTAELTACSQRYSYLHHPPAPNPGTPPGSYPLVITAYSNNGGNVTSHSLSFTLTVK